MKILGICASPRKKGNTQYIMKSIAEAIGGDYSVMYLVDYRIERCLGCEGCKDSFDCVIKDDFSKLVEAMLSADIVIWGTPTYWYNVTSDMKRMIDRMYSLLSYMNDERTEWTGIFEGKGIKGIPVAVCEQKDYSMMGFACENMKLVMNDLGIDVLEEVKVLSLFKAHEAKESVDCKTLIDEKVKIIKEKIKN